MRNCVLFGVVWLAGCAESHERLRECLLTPVPEYWQAEAEDVRAIFRADSTVSYDADYQSPVWRFHVIPGDTLLIVDRFEELAEIEGLADTIFTYSEVACDEGTLVLGEGSGMREIWHRR